MTKKAKEVPFDPKAFLATVDGGRTLSEYRTGKVIFSQGEPADAVFYVQKGQVKITVVSEQGKEAIVAVLGPDEFCGEGCLTGQARRMATATNARSRAWRRRPSSAFSTRSQPFLRCSSRISCAHHPG